MRVLVINPGATSTKISVFQEDIEIFQSHISHPLHELNGFLHIIDQLDYRKSLIRETLAANGYTPRDFDGVCGRGGLLRHIPSGTYRVTDRVIADIKNPLHGEHASNLGAILAKELAAEGDKPAFFVDPVSVDELQPIARFSGMEGMERESFFHALNQKSVARKAAKELGKSYEEVNLVVVHTGGGVSVAAHEKGQVIDVFDAKSEGSFSMTRGGSLPVSEIIDFILDSDLDRHQLKKRFMSEGGAYSYLKTLDFLKIEEDAYEGADQKAKTVFEAMAYQHAKDIGAMAAVLRYDVDAIVYTGGIAKSDRFCNLITSYVGKIAPVLIFPGEEEMRALAEGALRILHGEEAKDY